MSRDRTLLLVDDEDQVRRFLQQFLARHEWIITSVASGELALAALGARDFGVILCDLDLGRGLSGLDVLTQMRSKNTTTPFVMLTGHGTVDRCREAFLLGATDFFEKPFNQALLASTLEHIRSDFGEDQFEESPFLTSGDGPLKICDDAIGAAHVRHAIEIMERRYSEIDLSVTTIAKHTGVSPDHLARLFHAHVGRSPLEHLHRVRISRAEYLLKHSDRSIYEIGYECGYKRTSKFANWFRRLRGSVPSRFRLE